jgi:lysine-specific histone demethylase 1
VSNTYWDQDDHHGFKGPHVFVDGGYGQLCNGLAEDLNITFNAAVKSIAHNKGGMLNDTDNTQAYGKTVAASTNSTTNEIKKKRTRKKQNSIKLENGEEIKCDLIVVTVPLGCLQNGDIKFRPALPAHKSVAIKKMGAGNLNKVVLEFKECFWDPNDDMFGRVGECGEDRGHAYMFASFVSEGGSPAVLTAFMAGKAAQTLETKSEKEVIDGILKGLREMYGEKVGEPVCAHVSMWGTDKYARGAYSYVAVGCSGKDYDALSESVNDNLYFAGEHCNRTNPTTCAGAMLSGLSCAEEIARQHGRWTYGVIGALVREDGKYPSNCLNFRQRPLWQR